MRGRLGKILWQDSSQILGFFVHLTCAIDKNRDEIRGSYEGQIGA